MTSVATDSQFRVRLEGLFKLLDGLQAHVLLKDDDPMFRLLAQASQELFRAEDVSVFRVPDDRPEELVLAAQYPGPAQPPIDKIVIPADPEVNGTGLTGWCVAKGEVIHLQGERLRGHRAVYRGDQAAFKSGRCHSLLAVPLFLKPTRPLGLLKINNRLGPDGRPGDAVGFSEEDKYFAQILATKVAGQMESRRAVGALRDLAASGHTCRDPLTHYQGVLSTGARLLRCDRAMLALFDHERHAPVVVARFDRRTGTSGGPFPLPGVMRQCWEQGGPKLILDAAGDPECKGYDVRTRSAAAVRLEWEGLRFGVLGVESDRPGHFDEHDLDTLGSLVPFIAASYRAVDKEARFLQMLKELGTPRWSHRSVLQHLLQTVLSTFGFANGHIFVPTADGLRLKVEARHGPEDVDEAEIPEYLLQGAVTSVQARVFRTGRAYFSPAAETDPEFHPSGLRALRVRGPYVAAPLLVPDGRPVGVLSVWGGADSADSRSPTQADVPQLGQYARVAAAVIDLSAKRQAFLRTLAEAIPTLQKPTSPAELWPRLLGVVQQNGFARVRLFRYRPESQVFELLAAIGPNPPTTGYTVSAHRLDNRYAHDTVQKAGRSAAAFAYTGTEFGPDPDARSLGKEPGAPWIVIPLISHGRLYGQITADNGPDAGPVPAETLENLAVVGGVAALAVAQAETAAQLKWQSLDKLHAAVRYEDSERAIVRKLLVYLTHGQALGFSRAGYYAYLPGDGRFEFLTGLGSLTEGRFREVAQITDLAPIDQTLTNAERHADPEIEAEFERINVRLAPDELTGLFGPDLAARGFAADDRAGWPPWVRGLADRIHSRALIVLPVAGVGGKLYGLVAVDREWQDRPVSDADVALLTGFGRHAALLLGQRAAADQAIRADVWRDVALVASHRVSTPVSTIETEYGFIRQRLEPLDGELENSLDNMAQAIGQAKIVAGQFRVLRDVYHRTAEDPPTDRALVSTLDQAVRRSGHRKVRVHVEADPALVYRGHQHPLEECVAELVANACYWARQGGRSPEVVIRAAPDSLPPGPGGRRWVRLSVENNGPPIQDDKIRQFGRGVVKAGRPGGGGFGLLFVWEIASALGGSVEVANENGVVVFNLSIPQEA